MAPAFGNQEIPDPGGWYRDGYAPLWETSPGENVEAMMGYYADHIEMHSASGAVTSIATRDFIAVPVKAWMAEGWMSSRLQDLSVDQINATTASFKASWVDRNQDAPDELSCGWYLADFEEGDWQFTAYADLDCAAHGFALKKE